MLKNWYAPLLGHKAHYSYVRLLVRLGCSALSVSESDQETLSNQTDYGQILSLQVSFEGPNLFQEFIKLIKDRL